MIFGQDQIECVQRFEFDAYPELRPIDESRFAPCVSRIDPS